MTLSEPSGIATSVLYPPMSTSNLSEVGVESVVLSTAQGDWRMAEQNNTREGGKQLVPGAQWYSTQRSGQWSSTQRSGHRSSTQWSGRRNVNDNREKREESTRLAVDAFFVLEVSAPTVKIYVAFRKYIIEVVLVSKAFITA